MILDPKALSICEDSILSLTGERLARGDTGWLQVMARALSMGAAYKALWENKHGRTVLLESAPEPTRPDASPPASPPLPNGGD